MASFLALCLAGFFMSCDMPPSFGPEYSVNTTNFIAALPLASPPPATDVGSAVALGSPGAWDWAWRGKTDTTFTYMTMSSDGSVGTVDIASDKYTLLGTAPVWRIKSTNLAINPSFGTSDISLWKSFGVSSVARSTIDAISGYSLKVQTTSIAADYIWIDGTFFVDIDAYEHIYQLSFNLKNASTFRYEENFAYESNRLQNPAWSVDKRFFLPVPQLSGFNDTLSKKLFIVDASGSSFLIDDIHAIRTDIGTSRWALALRLRANDANPALVPGLYEFIIWVKKPDDCFYPTESGRGDSSSYAATSVTLRITRLGSTSRTLAAESYDMEALGDGWHRIALRMPATNALSFTEAGEDQILELSISPMNPLAPDAGALLISSPSLYYYIDGFD